MIGWSIVLIAMRLGEWAINGFSYQFPENNGLFLLYSLGADLQFICQAGLIVYVLFLLLGFISAKLARISFFIISILITLGYFALQKYFNSTTVLLGADLYGYSMNDIRQTVGASGGMNILSILLIVVLAAVIAGVFFLVNKKIRTGYKASAVMIGLLFFGVIIQSIFTDLKFSFKKEYDNNLAENKIAYFLRASYGHFFPPPVEVDIYSDAYSGDYGDTNGKDMIASFQYVKEDEFPFLHTENTADVLSPFLKKTDKAPNIVIILVEGLGRAFCNNGAYLGNFTPFLDSLSQHSLYWENFLSGGGRTFAVLPSMLGSLPFGKNGFNDLKNSMPSQLSLVSLLKKNGYSSSFFYAGEASFDNMDLFMKKQRVDHIYDKTTFPAGYTLLPANNGFSWGYDDSELYRYFMDVHAKEKSQQPFVDVLLTVSTHSPFKINNTARYENLFDKQLAGPALSEEQKSAARNYKQQYVTVLYADDALRNFFSQYSQRPEFANTIFLITGDHRMPEIPMSSKLDRYHVPLIVYSPLLQRPAHFQSVSSHFDITPSLLAYFKTNFAMQTPAMSSWLGDGLDTARGFRNIHSQALMQTKTDIIDFVKGEYHLNGDKLFKVTPTMQEEPVTDENIKNMLRGNFDRFLQRNEQMLQGKKLVPDSLISRYYPQ